MEYHRSSHNFGTIGGRVETSDNIYVNNGKAWHYYVSSEIDENMRLRLGHFFRNRTSAAGSSSGLMF